jgi:hypothetical protein
MPRFVILEHDHPGRHWDLMLEAGETLQTWRLSAPPGPGPAVAAERSFDHRRLYLDYEGPISGGRGQVTRHEGGTFDWEVVEEGRTVVRLEGTKLRGRLRLERSGDTWLATWESAERAVETAFPN